MVPKQEAATDVLAYAMASDHRCSATARPLPGNAVINKHYLICASSLPSSSHTTYHPRSPHCHWSLGPLYTPSDQYFQASITTIVY